MKEKDKEQEKRDIAAESAIREELGDEAGNKFA